MLFMRHPRIARGISSGSVLQEQAWACSKEELKGFIHFEARAKAETLYVDQVVNSERLARTLNLKARAHRNRY